MEPVVQRVDNYQRIGQHEAAHFLAARVLGFSVEKISMTLTGRGNEKEPPHDASATIHLHRNLCSTDHVSKYLRDRIQVLYAGPLGQALSGDVIDFGIAVAAQETNAAVDIAKAGEYLELLLNVERGDDDSLADPEMRRDARNELCGDLYQMATDIVVARTEEISLLGAALAAMAKANWGRESTLRVFEIDQILRGRQGGATSS